MSEDITTIDRKEIVSRLKIDGDLRMGEDLEVFKIYEGDPLGFYQTATCYLLDEIEKLEAKQKAIQQVVSSWAFITITHDHLSKWYYDIQEILSK